MIAILNNKAIISQNVFILKCACGSITNQDRLEINNSDWLLWREEGSVSSVKRGVSIDGAYIYEE